MYSLNNPRFSETFETIDQLISAVIRKGIDPNCEILRNGKPTREKVSDLLAY